MRDACLGEAQRLVYCTKNSESLFHSSCRFMSESDLASRIHRVLFLLGVLFLLRVLGVVLDLPELWAVGSRYRTIPIACHEHATHVLSLCCRHAITIPPIQTLADHVLATKT